MKCWSRLRSWCSLSDRRRRLRRRSSLPSRLRNRRRSLLWRRSRVGNARTLRWWPLHRTVHGRWLTLATKAVRICRAHAATTRRLLVYDLWPAVGVNRGRWLRGNISSGNFCLYVIIGQDAPIAVESATVIVVAAHDPSAPCACASCSRSLVAPARTAPVYRIVSAQDASSRRSADDDSVIGRRRR